MGLNTYMNRQIYRYNQIYRHNYIYVLYLSRIRFKYIYIHTYHSLDNMVVFAKKISIGTSHFRSGGSTNPKPPTDRTAARNGRTLGLMGWTWEMDHPMDGGWLMVVLRSWCEKTCDTMNTVICCCEEAQAASASLVSLNH